MIRFVCPGSVNRAERGAAAGVTSLARTTTGGGGGGGVCPAALMAGNPSRGESLRRRPSPYIYIGRTTTAATVSKRVFENRRTRRRPPPPPPPPPRPNSNNTCWRRAAISQLYIRYTPGGGGAKGVHAHQQYRYYAIYRVGTTSSSLYSLRDWRL